MYSFFATAAKGTEGALRDELRRLKLRNVRADRGGVHFEGELLHGMRVCLWSRVAMRVLLKLASSEAHGGDGLYEAVKAIPWEERLTLRRTFAVYATVKSSELTHSFFAAQRAKDAIVDRMREKLSGRPDVDTEKPDIRIVIHLTKNIADILLDLSGDSLSQRGYRMEGGEAPLRETLAASMLLLGGYDVELPLCDPMCGSGTIAIEAALMARNIAPGRGRHFGFMRWPAYGDTEAAAFRELQEEAKALALSKAAAPIIAYDRFAEPLVIAERNADRAGIKGSIQFKRHDVRELGNLPPMTQIFTNPPYGERLETKPLQLQGLFREMGEAFRLAEGISRVAILTGTPLFARSFGLKPENRHTLYNGPIEAKLLTYKMKQ